MSIYIIGSLANKAVPTVANQLRTAGFDVFSSWYCASENADIRWQEHEQGRGLTYIQALKDYAAQQVFAFDKLHLDRCDAAVLVYPAGRSGHLELGYVVGAGKPAYILMPEEPAKWDVMLNFASGIFTTVEELTNELRAGNGASFPGSVGGISPSLGSNWDLIGTPERAYYDAPANQLSQECDPSCGICTYSCQPYVGCRCPVCFGGSGGL